MMNRFGNIFSVTTFGESHGTAIGGVIDGMPAGIEISTDLIQKELDLRNKNLFFDIVYADIDSVATLQIYI